MLLRRHFLGATGATGALALAGCEAPASAIEGGFTGTSHERGHLLREPPSLGAPTLPTVTRRVHTLIAGGGVAGLAAARALRLRGQDDFALLELEDTPGGNSRPTTVGGIACPMGAHYLPVPGDDAPEVQNLLEELGLRRRVAGRWGYDERHLCHSPQERLYFNDEWQDGLLPLDGVGASTLAQYRRFGQLIREAQQAARYAIPAFRQPMAALQQAQAAITFGAWLDAAGLNDSHLRWYLDYSCRDDYGAGSATVSAWAGIHYFASRHGFHAPGLDGEAGGNDAASGRDAVLTWPEGNGWLTRQLALPLGERLLTGRVVLRIETAKHGVTVDALNTSTQAIERWQAERCIVCLPVFVAARVVVNPPAALREAATHIRYAPWLVANLHLRTPLHDRPGAPPCWDNVLYGSQGLGYVDAMHQSLRPVPGPTVLTCYRALGNLPDGRQQLLERPWGQWRDTLLTELAVPHPDLPAKVSRIDITRYGHAMAVPTPGFMSQIGFRSASVGHSLLLNQERLSFAHSDWSGYSVFEEAFARGHAAGGRG